MEFEKLKLNDLKSKTLKNLTVTYKDAINYKKFKEGKADKLTICYDPMFKYMFFNTNKLKYSAKLISLIIDTPYEKLLKNIKLLKNEYDKDRLDDIASRGDFIADIGESKVLIEINNQDKTKKYKSVFERDLGYQHKVYLSENRSGEEYKYNTTLLINMNNFYFEELDNWYQVFTINDGKGIKYTEKIIIIN